MKVNGDGRPIWLKELWEWADPSLAVWAEEEKCHLPQLKSFSLIYHTSWRFFPTVKKLAQYSVQSKSHPKVSSPLQTDVSTAKGLHQAPVVQGSSPVSASEPAQEQSPEIHIPQGQEGIQISLPCLCVWANEHKSPT